MHVMCQKGITKFACVVSSAFLLNVYHGRYESLYNAYKDRPNVHIMRDGYAVSRSSDFIIYSVETKNIESVVETYGPGSQGLRKLRLDLTKIDKIGSHKTWCHRCGPNKREGA